MIKMEHIEIQGIEPAIRGMRNPLNSWDRSDSKFSSLNTKIGENDRELMEKLSKAGSVHAKYKRMMIVYVDITAPLYWWKEFDTYKVGTVANSCSTMHKITSKPIEFSDFSIDDVDFEDGISLSDMFINTIADCEQLRQEFLKFNEMSKDPKYTEDQRKNFDLWSKKYWKGLIQLLPTSYNQKRTVMLNYEVLTNIYEWRKDHKLTEWRHFCEWIEKLPMSYLITGGESDV